MGRYVLHKNNLKNILWKAFSTGGKAYRRAYITSEHVLQEVMSYWMT